jgi:hypothetical protein
LLVYRQRWLELHCRRETVSRPWLALQEIASLENLCQHFNLSTLIEMWIPVISAPPLCFEVKLLPFTEYQLQRSNAVQVLLATFNVKNADLMREELCSTLCWWDWSDQGWIRVEDDGVVEMIEGEGRRVKKSEGMVVNETRFGKGRKG